MSFRSARTSRHLAVTFARNDLLFTMSDNTRRRTSRGRDEIACANLFFLRTSLSETDGITAGGARRDRTDDLLLAKQALSQLSYGPEPEWLANRSSQRLARASPFG